MSGMDILMAQSLLEHIDDKLSSGNKYEPHEIFILCMNEIEVIHFVKEINAKEKSCIDANNVKLYRNGSDFNNIKVIFVYSAHELSSDEDDNLSDTCSKIKIRLMLSGYPDKLTKYPMSDDPRLIAWCNNYFDNSAVIY
jgi:hypothetical protein